MAVTTLDASKRLAALEADVLEDLRQGFEPVADLGHGLVHLENDRQHLKRGDEAVAGRRIVGQDDVARLLTADVETVLAHVLQHIAVADRGACQLQAEAAEKPLEAEVGHHGGDNARPGTAGRPLARTRRRPPSAGRRRSTWPFSSTMTTRSASPSSAMPMSARMLAHLLRQRLGMGRAAIVVDVEAVGLDADGQ